MRRAALLAVLAACVCVLAGCQSLLHDDYLSISVHDDPFEYKEETEPAAQETEPAIPEASDYYGMKAILLSFVTQGVEHGQFRLVNYAGDAEADLREVTEVLKHKDPVGAYAIDYLECQRISYRDTWVVSVDAVYRRSSSEIQAIRSVRGTENAMQMITDELMQYNSSVTLRISGYQEDLEQRIAQYCMDNPNVVVEAPEISLSVYPDSGNVRVVEIHFSYAHDRETLRAMQTEVESIFNSAYNYLRYGDGERAKLSLTYAYLTSRFDDMSQSDQATVYSLLCEGVGNSQSFASVAAYLCKKAGMDCRIVTGEKDGEPYVWNIVRVDGVYYHLDMMHAALQQATTLTLRLDGEMGEYSWDTDEVPACDGVPVSND